MSGLRIPVLESKSKVDVRGSLSKEHGSLLFEEGQDGEERVEAMMQSRPDTVGSHLPALTTVVTVFLLTAIR